MSKLVKLINPLTVEPCTLQTTEIAGSLYVRDGTQFKSASTLGYKPLIETHCKVAGSTLSYRDDGNYITQVWTAPKPVVETPIINEKPIILEEEPQPSKPAELENESVNEQTQPIHNEEQPIIQEQIIVEDQSQPIAQEKEIIEGVFDSGNEQQPEQQSI